MKKLLFLLSVLFTVSIAFAQFKKIAEGPFFEEPEDGYARILQMKNGYTLFFSLLVKEGISVTTYDAKHKQKATRHIETRNVKFKRIGVYAIYEIQGNAVLFIAEVESRTPVLYRLIVDGTTGVLKEEKKIAELKKVNMGQGYAMAFGNVPPPDFYIRKDPNSDNYAVAMFNSFESDRSKRIEIVVYGSDNQEINRAYYNSPDDKYKYMVYVDMVVIGNEKVSAVAYAYNTRATGGKESELVLATLDAGAKGVTLNELEFSKDLEVIGGITRYNAVTKKLLLLAAAKAEKKSNKYVSFIATIDPFEKTIEKAHAIYPVEANNKYTELFGKKHDFGGMPQDLFVNNDGSFAVVYEEITDHFQEYFGSYHNGVYTDLNNIAVSKFDVDGKELSSVLIPKKQHIPKVELHTFYHYKRENSAALLQDGSQYKSFAYLSGAQKSYVLFNDVEKNGESMLKGKVTEIESVKDCDGFYFDISGTEVLPRRSFVFGKPDAKHEHDLGLFAVSSYDREHNIYVTLKLEKEERSKNVQLVWLEPQ